MRKRLLLLLFPLLLFCFHTASAETAKDLTTACTIKSCANAKNFRLTDGKYTKRFDGDLSFAKTRWIEVTAPKNEKIHGVYFMFQQNTPEVALQIRRDGKWETYAKVNTTYVHEYTELPGVSAFRLESTDGKGSLPIYEMRVIGEGELPDFVQVWEEPVEKADLMLFIAHPDDEYLFFGGLIPYYTKVVGAELSVVYMTMKNDTRLQEMLNGLWTAGYRHYPIILGFADEHFDGTARYSYKQWGEQKCLDTVQALLDRVQPEVVVTHDILGEYGHGHHVAVADLCLRIIRDGERPLIAPPKKLYLHLWTENEICMDWLTHYDELGGKSPLEVADEAFRCHVSQVGAVVKMRNGKKYKFEVVSGGPLDNARFGLAYSAVGADTGNDFLENVP